MENNFIFQIRTRYGETDQMGIIYYGVYPQYLEVARVEWLRNLGISYKELEEKGIMLPVISLQIDYKKPALYDQLLSIVLSLREKPTSKIIFNYQIFNESKELLIQASTTLVFVDKITFRPIKCPNFILEKINFH
ncbi:MULTISPECIES: acyl-CoA thioesterase [unclassified Capnocytophaga]|jgi:acyl-CoA thioester hydrolase, YbgC/YbaW family|uniref:acyl-CoA thioesterase n=1 Tax=unclassified Capnocytophaga TaxID=2640652 RepID=UPI000202C604|nr:MULTISPECIES: thioesterase family protein [unclassified Capnocytophaga]EGD33999.1 thioesterase [Capnocytophaga sp. oral taxon 338 str. F0234]MEB3004340.1 thioesterase family protein [Capnocytophaga sp. G2]